MSFRSHVAALLNTRYLRRLVTFPEGRAFFLGYLASLERDEVNVFDTLLSRVDDERLRKMVRVHYTDELRHAELLEARAASVGPAPIPAPLELNMPHRLEQALGGLVTSFLGSSGGVFEI